MRWLVVGANGMLGQDLVMAVQAAGHDVLGVDRDKIDITVPSSVNAVVVPGAFDVVVNCAAWTAVDDAESHEPQAFAINAVGPALLARASRDAGARLVQISTDYVFGGDGAEPYAEDAPAAPRSAYGRTKAAGEWAVRAEQPDHLIVRTAWLYGAHGPCFPKTMARLAATQEELTVVDDQLGQPTWTVDLAELILRLVESHAPTNTYHGTSSGAASWFEFARAVVTSAGYAPDKVRPMTSANLVRPAPRPAYSVLGHGSLASAGVSPIGAWADRWVEASKSILANV